MTKRITITSGDYILLSDIPNEQVFNLVKKCFENAGFPSSALCTWDATTDWECYVNTNMYTLTPYSILALECSTKTLRQLSLSDVFNSTNGGFRWFGESYVHIYKHEILFSGSMYASCPPPLVTIERDDDTRYVYAKLQIETTPVDMRTMDEIMQEFLNEITKKETPMTNKPDTYKISKAFDVNNLQHMSIESVQGRALGKSTAHHLELISKAMKSPEVWIEITSDYDNLQRHHHWAFEEVRALCYKLNLDWMEFSVSGNSIRYMPYQTVKMVTKWEVVE